MLKYKVHLSSADMETVEVDWSEKYLDPSTDFVCGVTSPLYNLEDVSYITASSPLVNSTRQLSVSARTVNRQGCIVVQEKEYEVEEYNR